MEKGRRLIGSKRKTEQARLCSTCENYDKDKLNCRLLGKIKYPDTVAHCSWWKDKEEIDKKPQIKRCSSCGEVKHISEFYKSEQNGKNGYRDVCKSCLVDHEKKYYRKMKLKKI